MDKPFFAPLIRRWDTVVAFSDDVGCPERTAREWLRIDSIPATWFSAVARAAVARGLLEITTDLLAARAEARRLSQTYQAARKQAAA
jgi:hypothetical protein